MSWDQFRANWIINDYRASVRKHGPCPEDRWALVWVILRLWYLGLMESAYARARLREVVS